MLGFLMFSEDQKRTLGTKWLNTRWMKALENADLKKALKWFSGLKMFKACQKCLPHNIKTNIVCTCIFMETIGAEIMTF